MSEHILKQHNLNTVGAYANEQIIQNYVKKQGQKYEQLHRTQLTLFDT